MFIEHKSPKNYLWATLALAMLLLPAVAAAAGSELTFESFYKEDNAIFWVRAALAAVAAGALLFFAVGAATPVVASIGTWVGGLMGYSGAVATNAGLALLGGGSIAAGGLGMAGGAALLTAALTFGTEVVVDASISKAQTAYDYAAFTKLTQNMATLPLPKNDSGPPSIQAAYKFLKSINEKADLRSAENLVIISKALDVALDTPDPGLNDGDNARKKTFIALLQLTLGRPREAQLAASAAYGIGERAQLPASMPAFLLAVTMLHDEQPDVTRATNLLKQAITVEPSNPLTPLLFSMFSDRLLARVADGTLPASAGSDMVCLLRTLPNDERSAAIHTAVATRVIVAVKLEQQHLLALRDTHNDTMLSSPVTVEKAQGAVAAYQVLLAQLDLVLQSGERQIDEKLGEHLSPRWGKQWSSQWMRFYALSGQYHGNTSVLIAARDRIQARYQARLAKPASAPKAVAVVPPDPTRWYLFVALALIAGAMGGWLLGRRPRAA